MSKQISAVISETTSDLLDQHLRATGLEEGDVVEEALRHHLQALHELPTDVIIRPRVLVSSKSGEAILHEIETAAPTGALRDLMRNGD